MCDISFAKEALNITIRNQYPDLELTSPVYFSTNTAYSISPSQQADVSNAMETSFWIVFTQEDFKVALLYKLQRKHAASTNNHPNNSTAFTKDAATNIHLLVVCDIGEHNIINACLLEYDNDFTWDEDKLWALYHRYNDQLRNYDYGTITWLIHDDVVMKIRHDITYGSDYKLDIILSEGIGKYDMKRPMRIDPRRLVLPLLMLIVLIYLLLVSLLYHHSN
jgi:hypothetical protein